jgi:V8-like Glu-specific endopeptidase
MLSTLRSSIYPALVCACAVTAFAQGSPLSNTAKPKASASAVLKTDSEAKAAQAFWTPSELSSARPMPMPKLDPESIRSNAAPLINGAKAEPMIIGKGGLPSIHVAPSDDQQEPFSLNRGTDTTAEFTPETVGFNYEMPFNNYKTQNNTAYPYTAMGKLFFTIPEGASEPAGTYVCSAAVAVDGHTLVTARHCMFDYSTGKWYSNWTFYPGWASGPDNSLHGGWTVNFAYTWTSNASGWDYDIGLLSMHDSTGRGCGGDSGSVIGSYTGWLGYSYGGDFSQRQWNVFGYPQEAPFAGNNLYQDNAATGTLNPLGTTNVIEVGNPQTGGTSGGPWVIGFNPNDANTPAPNSNTNTGGFNLINGVNSFKWTNPNHPYSINGPAFQGYNFWNLYAAYQKAGCQ